MRRRKEGDETPLWKRVEVVMKVQMGLMNVTEAARELGVTRAYYYVLEEEMLRASLLAVTPGKRGPKGPAVDPKMQALEEKLREQARERELLQLKVKHLEELQREMVTRGIGVLREKKRPGGAASRRYGPKVHGEVQADGAVEGRGTPGRGRHGREVLSGDGPPPGESVAVEDERGGRDEARTQGTRG